MSGVISKPSRAVIPTIPFVNVSGNEDRVPARLRVPYHYRMDTIRIISSSFSTRKVIERFEHGLAAELGVVLPYLAPSP